MSNTKKAFENGKAFIGFVTAGDPDLETSEKIILSMAEGGCDLIEIGIPFSDPIAEGPVVQEANLRSLSQGATTDKVLELTKKVSSQTDTPLVYMTYLNVLFKYGYDRFLQKAKDAGISAVIVPDLPFEEKDELQSVAVKYDIDVISMIAPSSSERMKKIACESKGFLYAVPSAGAQNDDNDIKSEIKSVVKAAAEVSDTPVAIGIGINTPEQAKEYSDLADGVIVGSAIVEIVAEYGKNAPQKVYEYVKTMKDAIR